MVAAAEFRALGTGVRVLATRPDGLAAARTAVERHLGAVDLACSRFRDDSELARLGRTGGRATPVSPLLASVLAASLRVARATDGAVDPTVGGALRAIGYDRDFGLLLERGGPIPLVARPVPGWRRIELDVARGVVRVPDGLELDLGSTAKACAADRCAAAAARAAGCGVLVSLGGDLALAGEAPEGGWTVLVTDDHAAGFDAPGQVISLTTGGLATSSTTVRRWRRGEVELHHIVDPATGLPAAPCWRTVSVGAATCVDANAAATASIVWGERALAWLDRHRLPARLVRTDGSVVTVGDWPADEGTP